MASHEDVRHDQETDDSMDYMPRPDLSDLEENYRTLVENAPEIFFIVDLKGKFILLNQAVYAFHFRKRSPKPCRSRISRQGFPNPERSPSGHHESLLRSRNYIFQWKQDPAGSSH